MASAACQCSRVPSAMHLLYGQFSKQGRWLSLPIDTSFEIVAADIFGPLKPTARGHTHILVLIDHHIRWVELIELPEPTAELVAEAIFEHWISRWGTMRALVTDDGRRFTARLLQQLTDMYGIKHIYSSPYNPRGNFVVESYMRTLKTTLEVVHAGIPGELGRRHTSSRLSISGYSSYRDRAHAVLPRDRSGGRSTAVSGVA